MAVMPSAAAPPEITTREALEILNLSDPSTISKYVRSGKLTPSRKLPGRTGAFLFFRADIEQLAGEIVESAS